jgi:hypothetical protein
MEEKNDSKGAFAQPLLAKQVIIYFSWHFFYQIQHIPPPLLLYIYFSVVKILKFARCFDLTRDLALVLHEHFFLKMSGRTLWERISTKIQRRHCVIFPSIF